MHQLPAFAASTCSIVALLTSFLPGNTYSPFAGADGPADAGPPIVKITAPHGKDSYSWNSLVSYRITVTYQGKSSEYQEIPAREVLLRASYVPYASVAAKADSADTRPPLGLLLIARSTCLGCHSFKGKAMGPSFAAVGQRYPQSEAAVDVLSQHIRKGATGGWGQETMPPQPDLTEDQVHAIARWILKDAANPNVTYYTGTEGTFRMEGDVATNAKGGVLLTASYTSPTPTATPDNAAFGADTVLLAGK